MKHLQVKHLAKRYGKRQVIHDVSLEVKPGEIVGLLGPNGAGKTTCFYMIVGLVSRDQGQILLNGSDIGKLSLNARAQKGIGYLPQEASVFRQLSVKQNIMSVLELRKKLTKSERTLRCQELLEEFNITHISESAGAALSGGERRRVEIARALALEPDYILLDEPFAGVDPISVNDIKSIVHQLKHRNIGVLITDHNVRETLDLCERAYIVGEGRVIAEGEPQTILNNEKVRQVYLGEDFRL